MSPQIKRKIPKIVAYVFAMWTLQNIEHHFSEEGASSTSNYLMTPHAAQVISIFRMLGLGNENKNDVALSNHMVQIALKTLESRVKDLKARQAETVFQRGRRALARRVRWRSDVRWRHNRLRYGYDFHDGTVEVPRGAGGPATVVRHAQIDF